MDPAHNPSSNSGRRDFLRVAAASIAALSSFPSMTTASASPRAGSLKPFRFAVKYGMVKPGATVLEKFKLLKDLGYDGVELDYPGGPPADDVIRAKEATGLEVPGVVDSVHWSKPLSDPSPEVRAAGRVALEEAIRACSACGGRTVLLVPAVVNKTVSYADAYQRSQDEIRRVLPLAAELDITIAIENVWNNFLLSPLEAARYTDELQSEHVAWHFDIGNIVNYGWPEHWIRALGKRIVRLDVKEFSRKKRDDEGLWKGFNAEIGEGDCGWPAVLEALDGIGYEGWATAEVGGGDETRLADILHRMRSVLHRP